MNRRVGTTIRLAIGLALLAFLVRRIDLGQAVETLTEAHPIWLLTAVLAQFAAKTFWVLRWRALLRAVDHPQPAAELFRLILVGLFFNNFLPSSVGGDVVRVLGLARCGVSRAVAAATVLGDRVVGILALAILASVGGILGPRFWPGEGPWGAGAVFAGVTILLVLAFGNPAVLGRLARLRGLPKTIARRAQRLLDSLALLAGRTRGVAAAVTLSLGLAACSAVFHWSVARSVDIQVPLMAYFVIIPTVMLFAALPITLNGLGIRELGLVGFLGAQGVPESNATVFALLAFALPLVFAAAGGLLFLVGGRRIGGDESREVTS